MISVIKLGGSLIKNGRIQHCLEHLDSISGTKVIVPGGGGFADQVRQAQVVWGFDDRIAHRMALLAMQQSAWLMHSLQPASGFLSNISTSVPNDHNTHFWLPNIDQLNAAGIAASWQVTSDSLAMWLADQLNAQQLILVKSARIDPQASLADLQVQGILDQAFLQFAQHSAVSIRVVHLNSFLQDTCSNCSSHY